MADEKNDGAIKANIYAEQPGDARPASTVTIPLPPAESNEVNEAAQHKLNSKQQDDKEKEATQTDTSGEDA